MPPYWTQILRGAQKARERQRLAEEPRREEERARARDIFKAVLEGQIEPTERPEEALFRGPRREVVPPDIGARIMEGLGIRRPQYEPGRMYRRVPATIPTIGPREEITTRYGPRGEIAGYTVSPRKEKAPTWQQQQTDAAIRTGLNRGIGLVAKGPFGELEQMPIKSYADALTFLQYSKRDPAQFQGELQFYKDIVQTGPADDGRTLALMKDGRVFDMETREEIPRETLIER